MIKHLVRIKTGFFETTLYHLIIDKDILQLKPEKDTHKASIEFKSRDLNSIELLKDKGLRIEIIGRDEIIQGLIEDCKDDKCILDELRHNLKTKIKYEEGYYEK